LSTNLSTNLISIGQLVDHDYNVQFSYFGCVVQDQMLGKIILKGPEVGQLFQLCFSPSTYCPAFSVVCFDNRQLNKMRHNRLGHPNSHVFSTLFKSDSLSNKDSYVSFDCTTCKLGKSKTLPFPYNASRANYCFDIIHSDV